MPVGPKPLLPVAISDAGAVVGIAVAVAVLTVAAVAGLWLTFGGHQDHTCNDRTIDDHAFIDYPGARQVSGLPPSASPRRPHWWFAAMVRTGTTTEASV